MSQNKGQSKRPCGLTLCSNSHGVQTSAPVLQCWGGTFKGWFCKLPEWPSTRWLLMNHFLSCTALTISNHRMPTTIKWHRKKAFMTCESLIYDFPTSRMYKSDTFLFFINGPLCRSPSQPHKMDKGTLPTFSKRFHSKALYTLQCLVPLNTLLYIFPLGSLSCFIFYFIHHSNWFSTT